MSAQLERAMVNSVGRSLGVDRQPDPGHFPHSDRPVPELRQCNDGYESASMRQRAARLHGDQKRLPGQNTEAISRTPCCDPCWQK